MGINPTYVDNFEKYYIQANLYNVVYFAIDKAKTEGDNEAIKDTLNININNINGDVDGELYNKNFRKIKDGYYTIGIKYSTDDTKPEDVEIKYLGFDAVDFGNAYCFDENQLFKIIYNNDSYNCDKNDSLILKIKTEYDGIKKIEIRKGLQLIGTIYI